MAELKQTNNSHAEEEKKYFTFQNWAQIPAISSLFKKRFNPVTD